MFSQLEKGNMQKLNCNYKYDASFSYFAYPLVIMFID